MLEKKTEMNKKYWAERNKIGKGKIKNPRNYDFCWCGGKN
jgi:hypothetical protein